MNTKTGLRSRDLPTDTEEENVETVVLRMLSTRLETSANPAFVTEEIPAPNIAIEEKGNDVENLTSPYPAVELTPPSAMVHTSSFRPSLSRVSEDPLDGSAQDNRTREVNPDVFHVFFICSRNIHCNIDQPIYPGLPASYGTPVSLPKPGS